MKRPWKDPYAWVKRFAYWPVQILNERTTVWWEPYYARDAAPIWSPLYTIDKRTMRRTQEKHTAIMLGAEKDEEKDYLECMMGSMQPSPCSGGTR